MPISRSTLITGATTAAIAPSLAQAALPTKDHQAPGFYRFKLRDYEIAILHDGAVPSPMPAGFVGNVDRTATGYGLVPLAWRAAI